MFKLCFKKKLNLFREPKSLEIEINDRSNRIPVFRNTFIWIRKQNKEMFCIISLRKCHSWFTRECTRLVYLRFRPNLSSFVINRLLSFRVKRLDRLGWFFLWTLMGGWGVLKAKKIEIFYFLFFSPRATGPSPSTL